MFIFGWNPTISASQSSLSRKRIVDFACIRENIETEPGVIFSSDLSSSKEAK